MGWLDAVQWLGALMLAAGAAALVVFIAVSRRAVERAQGALVALASRRDDLTGVLRAALELSPAQPAIVNNLQEHTVVLANNAFHAALGLPPGSLNGRPYLPLIHPDDLARTAEAADNVPLMDPSARFVNRWQGADGWVSLEWQGGHYADAQGYGLSLATPTGKTNG